MAHYLRKKKRHNLSLTMSRDLFFLLWIARDKGFFFDQKLNLNLRHVPYLREGMDILKKGDVDCGVFIEANIAYLGYNPPKVPIKFFASVEQRFGDHVLFRHEGTHKHEAADLKGKLIGFMPRTTSHTFLMRFLEHYNIDKKDIRLKVLTPQAMPNALIRGEVDAISCWQPHAHNTSVAMDELGINYTLFENTGFYASEVILATTKPYLMKNRQTIQRFLRGLHMAKDYIAENKEELTPIIVSALNLSGSKHDKILDKYKPSLKPIGDEYVNNLRLLGEWIRENDTQYEGHPLPDYEDFIDRDFFLDTFPNHKL